MAKIMVPMITPRHAAMLFPKSGRPEIAIV